MSENRNALGEKLEVCSPRPMTDFYQTGCCETGLEDVGTHAVCAEVTAEFLPSACSAATISARPCPISVSQALHPGDRWCLCAARWNEALDAGAAPRVVHRATHQEALEHVSLDVLKRYALDPA